MGRSSLLALLGFVALTSIAGGAVMVVGAWLGPDRLGIAPGMMLPPDLLQGSPFNTYLIPGLLLSIIIGGLHLTGFILLIRHHRHRVHYRSAGSSTWFRCSAAGGSRPNASNRP